MVDRYQQSVGIESAPLRDEVILFHSSSNKFCVLNRTSSFIWSELKQPATGAEIAERLGASFGGVDLDKARSDVDSALGEMLSLGLVVRC
ncbi:MAG TPA: PqqD family protein [Burkholderiaceae bacterium]|nr:PqqD family protein [Burkholderiaceae bacterium]